MPDCPICAKSAAIWQAGQRGELPEPRWDEAAEQRMSQIAESFDDETRTHRPLGPRMEHR